MYTLTNSTSNKAFVLNGAGPRPKSGSYEIVVQGDKIGIREVVSNEWLASPIDFSEWNGGAYGSLQAAIDAIEAIIYPSSAGGGGMAADVTIDGDNVGLAREATLQDIRDNALDTISGNTEDTALNTQSIDGKMDTLSTKLDDIKNAQDDNAQTISSVQRTHDAPATTLSNRVGKLAIAVREDTPTEDTSTDGDYTALKATNLGELYVKDRHLETDIKPLLETIDQNTDNTQNELGEIKLWNSGNYDHADITVATLYAINTYKMIDFIVVEGSATVDIDGSVVTYYANNGGYPQGYTFEDGNTINDNITITPAASSVVRVITRQ